MWCVSSIIPAYRFGSFRMMASTGVSSAKHGSMQCNRPVTTTFALWYRYRKYSASAIFSSVVISAILSVSTRKTSAFVRF